MCRLKMGKIKPYTKPITRKKSRTFHKIFENISEKSENGPVSKTLKDYSGATTIHGIPYLLEKSCNPFERILWLVVIAIQAIFFGPVI